ncbi:MAG TPA: porin family protein [Puia sp.]|nr:porin family protein [Puia sp.]
MLLKKCLPFCSLIFFSIAAFSQESRNDFAPRIGIKGGLSIATIIKSDNPDISSQALLGFNGGAVLQLPLGKYIAIQPEVLFSQKGYHASGSNIGGDYDYRRYLNFLDIPLLLRINLAKEFGLVVGPQYSYLLSTHTSFKSGGVSYQEDVNNDNSNITKNIFGGVIGADINLNHNLFLYGRYTIDFKNNNGDGTSSTPSYKNQVFQFGLGVLL